MLFTWNFCCEEGDGFGDEPGAVFEAAGHGLGECLADDGPILGIEAFHRAAGIEIAERRVGCFESQGCFDECD